MKRRKIHDYQEWLGNYFRIVLIATIILLSFRAAALEVEFLPQIHAPSWQPSVSEEEFETVVKSQFKILKKLAAAPHATVFVEYLTPDYTLPASVKKSRELFADGIPDWHSKLTREQKQALYWGATDVAKQLNLNRSYRVTSMSPLAESKNLNWVRNNRGSGSPEHLHSLVATHTNPELTYRVLQLREEWAVTNIKNYAKSTEYQEEPIFLVYGAAHDFPRYTSRELNIKVPEEFIVERVSLSTCVQRLLVGPSNR